MHARAFALSSALARAPSHETVVAYLFSDIDAPGMDLFHVTCTAAIVVAVRWGRSDLRSDASHATQRVRRALPVRPR